MLAFARFTSACHATYLPYWFSRRRFAELLGVPEDDLLC